VEGVRRRGDGAAGVQPEDVVSALLRLLTVGGDVPTGAQAVIRVREPDRAILRADDDVVGGIERTSIELACQHAPRALGAVSRERNAAELPVPRVPAGQQLHRARAQLAQEISVGVVAFAALGPQGVSLRLVPHQPVLVDIGEDPETPVWHPHGPLGEAEAVTDEVGGGLRVDEGGGCRGVECLDSGGRNPAVETVAHPPPSGGGRLIFDSLSSNELRDRS